MTTTARARGAFHRLAAGGRLARTRRRHEEAVMVKYFCDACGAEITPSNTVGQGRGSAPRLGTTVRHGGMTLGVEVITIVDGVSNAGVVCKYCVLDALYRLDDRPLPA